VAEVWEVLKPTVDGGVTAVEVLDSAGGQTVQLFGARKPGLPEDGRWRVMVGGLRGWGKAGAEVG
jgi:putative hemin transport protein